MPKIDIHDTVKRKPVPASLVLLGWHLLVIVAYIVVLSRQSRERVHYVDSLWDRMLVFGINVGAPWLLVTLIAGLILLWLFPSKRGQIGWPFLRGSLAAVPLLLLVVAIIRFVPR
ncbi:hypothetical protein ACGFIR_09595 [Micromonospora sp. NPDC049051]|uniref:hypothetical protein n=1 Tax=Micromonospora sp. NPDC049051 TaxID=3364264 RepID=UPI003714A6C1